MSDLSDFIQRLKFDKRMRSWNLNQKVNTPGEYEKHEETLEDISHLQEDSSEEESDQSS